MKTLTIRTERRTQFVNITNRVEKMLADVQGEAVGLLFVPHTTAGITINESADPDVMADVEAALSGIVPWAGPWRHSEGNSAAHIKASLVGSSVLVPVGNGQLRLGRWQAIYFCEFDGPRMREVWVLLNTASTKHSESESS